MWGQEWRDAAAVPVVGARCRVQVRILHVKLFSDVMKTSFCCVVAGLRLIRLVRRIAGNGMKE